MQKSRHFQNWGIDEFLEGVKKSNLDIDIGVNDSSTSAYVERGGKKYLNFCNINFLSVTDLPEVRQAFLDGIEQYGYVTGGSRSTVGIPKIHVDLEEMISRILRKEKTLTFMTGWLANQGFASSVTMRVIGPNRTYLNNNDAVVFLDQDSHRSILDSFNSKKNKIAFFNHNDVNHLESLFQKNPSSKQVVIFESVYSSDGSVAPIKDIVALCNRYGAMSYVDNANGFLIYGLPNQPFYDEFQFLSDTTAEMLSFSKTVGLEGGAVSSGYEFMKFMELLSPTSIFTAMIQPPTAMSILKTIEILQTKPEIIDGYLDFVEDFRKTLLFNNFIISKTPSYMISIFIGKDHDAIYLQHWLKQEKNILVPVFRFPAVKRNKAVLRIIPSRSHAHSDVVKLINALNEANKILRFKDIEVVESEYTVQR